MDEAGPQSLFVVLSYGYDSPFPIRILQLDTEGGHNSESKPSKFQSKFRKFFSQSGTEIAQNKCVAQFGRHQGPAQISWVFSSSSTSTTEEEEEEKLLYMVPYYPPQHQNIDVALHGCVFNFTTKTCLPFNSPQANKFRAHVLNVDGYLYFIASPSQYRSNTPKPSFERYDPAYDSWETLEPFPYDVLVKHPGNFGKIVATAVLSDTILFNIGGYEIWAYSVPKKKWYHVEVEDKQCYRIVGEAVVLADTIYALAVSPFNLILALSIEFIPTNGDGDLVFKCHLLSEILVRGMKPFSFRNASMGTRRLCHLGKDNLCLVESCDDASFLDYSQPIRLTNIKLKGQTTMVVTGICGHLLRIPEGGLFHVDFCFSLPHRKANALKEGKSFVFDLNPFPEGFDPNQKNKNLLFREAEEEIVTTSLASISLGDGVASTRVSTNKEGCSICVRNISPDATYNQLEEELKKFGPLEEIEVIVNKTGEVYALVDFIDASSKENAVMASSIEIAGCPAVIEY